MWYESVCLNPKDISSDDLDDVIGPMIKEAGVKGHPCRMTTHLASNCIAQRFPSLEQDSHHPPRFSKQPQIQFKTKNCI